jgi:hypothetical protein
VMVKWGGNGPMLLALAIVRSLPPSGWLDRFP